MAITEQVNIVLNAETGRYEVQIRGATRATDKLGDAIDDTEKKAVAGAGSISDLGQVAKQMGESAVDSATGVTGLGAAFSKIGARVKVAAQSMSAFSKAMIATGIGAAIAGIALLVTYWDDIAKFLGIATANLEEFNDETDRQVGLAEQRVRIAKLLGETQEQILKREIEAAEIKAKGDLKILLEYNQARAKAARVHIVAGVRIRRTEEQINEILKDQNFNIEEINGNYDESKAKVISLRDELDLLRNPPADPDADENNFGIPTDEQIEQAGLSQAQLSEGLLGILVDTNNKRNEINEEFRVNEFADEEEHVEDLTELYEKQAEDRLKIAKELAAAQKVANSAVAKSEVDTAAGVFDSIKIIAGDSLILQGAIGIAEVIVSTSRAIAGVTASLAAVPFGLTLLPAAIAAIKANGIKQAAIIAAVTGAKAIAAGGGGEEVNIETPTTQRDQVGASEFGREGGERRFDQAQVVLVTEDLNAVQDRVAVTESRASI